MPRLEKLLLLRVIAGLWALPTRDLVTAEACHHGQSVEVIPDQIKQTNTQTWIEEPDSDKTNYFDTESQAYGKIFEFI